MAKESEPRRGDTYDIHLVFLPQTGTVKRCGSAPARRPDCSRVVRFIHRSGDDWHLAWKSASENVAEVEALSSDERTERPRRAGGLEPAPPGFLRGAV